MVYLICLKSRKGRQIGGAVTQLVSGSPSTLTSTSMKLSVDRHYLQWTVCLLPIETSKGWELSHENISSKILCGQGARAVKKL